MPAIEIFVVAALALVHLFAHRLFAIDRVPRSRWLSLAGGASVAYVFLHILPELAAHSDTLAGALQRDAYGAEQLVYGVAMLGLVTFYALERLIRTRAHTDASRLHLASYGLYNALIGYLVFHREEPGVVPLALFAVAMGLHFVTVDHGLRHDHAARYDGWGRYALVGSLVLGAMVGWATVVPWWVEGTLFALLAGSVLLNVLKEELPEERESRLAPFVAGALGYGALLIAA